MTPNDCNDYHIGSIKAPVLITTPQTLKNHAKKNFYMVIWEKKSPGGDPRRGVLGLDTTRGDRLFISLLGSAFIHLFWLALVGSVLWIATIICVAYFVLVFKYV